MIRRSVGRSPVGMSIQRDAAPIARAASPSTRRSRRRRSRTRRRSWVRFSARHAADLGDGCRGLSVQNQNYASIIDPGASGSAVAFGVQANYFPFGSGARIAVKADPALVSLEGGSINQNVSRTSTTSAATLRRRHGLRPRSTRRPSTNVYALAVGLVADLDAGCRRFRQHLRCHQRSSGDVAAVNGNFQVISTSISSSDTLINTASSSPPEQLIGTIGTARS